MTAIVTHGNAAALQLPDETVDLIVTSPPYFGLRSYTDGGEHYAGQVGDETTPAEYLDTLIACTAEWMRVLKPGGSIFVNLGDSYAGSSRGSGSPISDKSTLRGNGHVGGGPKAKATKRGERTKRVPPEQMTRSDAAWLAGVIDSDGSVSVHVNKQPEGNAPSLVAWVRIGQMRPEVVQRAAEITGTGQVYKDARGVWNWSASAQQARWVLERIWPWLLIKQRPALAAIEVARHVEERNAKGSWRKLTSDDIAYRQRLRDAVLTWNSGGDDDLEPPRARKVSLPDYPGEPKAKSLTGLPWRYAIRCIDELGLILRAEIVWAKPNGLPESVTDRVRRSHEQVFHFVKQPRYFSAVDEVREEHSGPRKSPGGGDPSKAFGPLDRGGHSQWDRTREERDATVRHPLGKLPGSVWEIPTVPLHVPDHLGIDHFAAYPPELVRRIVLGWSPREVCTTCGEGRRPVIASVGLDMGRPQARRAQEIADRSGLTEEHFAALLSVGVSDTGRGKATQSGTGKNTPEVYALADEARAALGGYAREYLLRRPTSLTTACACPDTAAPAAPGVVLDPFGGTGTTALVASVLGRVGISVDLSLDYCRLARWRTTDPGERARALGAPKPAPVPDAQLMFDGWSA